MNKNKSLVDFHRLRRRAHLSNFHCCRLILTKIRTLHNHKIVTDNQRQKTIVKFIRISNSEHYTWNLANEVHSRDFITRLHYFPSKYIWREEQSFRQWTFYSGNRQLGVNMFMLFLRKPNYSSRHVECSFDNPVKNFSLRVRKKSLEVRKKVYIIIYFKKSKRYKIYIILTFDSLECWNSFLSVTTLFYFFIKVSVDSLSLDEDFSNKSHQYF